MTQHTWIPWCMAVFQKNASVSTAIIKREYCSGLFVPQRHMLCKNTKQCYFCAPCLSAWLLISNQHAIFYDFHCICFCVCVWVCVYICSCRGLNAISSLQSELLPSNLILHFKRYVMSERTEMALLQFNDDRKRRSELYLVKHTSAAIFKLITVPENIKNCPTLQSRFI